ncbi:MAG: hypothetical protein LKG06_06340 [Bifidobacterium subtile]|jgi:hypothetical protein|nr:hypothetical protein [Bifidobacterium subtile]MCI1241742.1 hypothetical protein [Bifidobacterium subtile]
MSVSAKRCLMWAVAMIAVVGILFSSTAPAFASAPAAETISQGTAVSNELKEKAGQYIILEGKYYSLNIRAASSELTNKEIKQVEESISTVNRQLTMVYVQQQRDPRNVFVGNDEGVITTSSQPLSMTSRSYKEGVNKVEWYWWGARIYLSKTTVRWIGAGVTVGGIWVPEPVVSKILATIGAITAATVQGGIVFDANAALISMGFVVMNPMWEISNIHYQ